MAKTWLEKMNGKGDLPKRVRLEGGAARRAGGEIMVIPSPWDLRRLIATIPRGKVATVAELRVALAREANADVACPMTAGIFTWIASNYAAEAGEADFPWWRTLKSKGELISRHPGGVEEQRRRLAAEGIACVERKARIYVEDLGRFLATL
jgi:alkylated DNA nucleotide flippase Atl1